MITLAAWVRISTLSKADTSLVRRNSLGPEELKDACHRMTQRGVEVGPGSLRGEAAERQAMEGVQKTSAEVLSQQADCIAVRNRDLVHQELNSGHS